MQLTSRTVLSSFGIKRVVVVAPDRDDAVAPTSLEELRAGRDAMLYHATVAARVRRDPEPIHAVVLRERSPGESWLFRDARSLDDDELDDLGYELARAQLEAWRPLLRRGVLAVARVEQRVWQLAASRAGTARLVAELDAIALGDDRGATAARHDRWLLRHALLDFGAGLETVLGELLPSRLDELERAGRVDQNRSLSFAR